MSEEFEEDLYKGTDLESEAGENDTPVEGDVEPDKEEDKPVNDEVNDDNDEVVGDSLLAKGTEEDKDEPEDTSKDEDKNKDDDYTLELQDGSLMSESMLDELKTLAKESNLNKEQAESFMKLQSNALDSFIESQEKEMNNKSTQWVEDIKKDEELGGPNFKQSISDAQQAFKQFGTKEFQEAIDVLKIGNHPEVIRTFSRIGKFIKDDPILNGSRVSTTKELSFEDSMYGEGDL